MILIYYCFVYFVYCFIFKITLLLPEQLLEAGDVVEGSVVVKTKLALGVRVTSLVSSWKVRAWEEVDLKGLVPAECLADSREECEVILRDMQPDDIVHG